MTNINLSDFLGASYAGYTGSQGEPGFTGSAGFTGSQGVTGFTGSIGSSYTNADVDAHLNTSTAASGEVLSWNGSDYDWVAVSGGAFTADGSNNLYAISTMPSLTTGTNNFGAGYLAGVSLTSGQSNTAIGWNSGRIITTGSYNTTIGSQAGYSLGSGSDNIMLGQGAGYSISTTSGHVLIGKNAGRYATTGSRNIAIGEDAFYGDLSAKYTGWGGVAIGFKAGYDVTTGGYNVLLGQQAGENLTTGAQNFVAGQGAGTTLTAGSYNTVVGTGAQPSSATVSNEITLGNSSIATLRCQVTTITSLSDARDKTDIKPINAGLEFVEALNPVSFTWNMRDGGKVGVADTGFIAQDLQAAQADTGVSIPGLVYDVNPDKLEAGYGKLIPVLVQAIKDLSAKVNLLEAQLEAQK